MHPISFGPTSRRQFLGAATAGATAITLAPKGLLADGRRRAPLSLVVVSDTHLGYRDQPSAAAQWAKTATELAERKESLVLHLGDVVDGGREDQYPIYLESRRRINKPVHEIPGNHDPPALFEKYLRDPIDTAVDHQWLRILLLNNSRTDSHDGFLGDKQIEWIDRQCLEAERREMLVLIGMHVPVHSNRHPDRGWYVKPDQGQTQLYDTLRRHENRVLALLHGHFHNGIRGWDDHSPVHEVCLPSALYNLDRRLEAQQAPGYNPLEFRPGYTRVAFEGGAMKLTYQPTGQMPGVEHTCLLRQSTT
jgi:predicted phosphodiesterase